MCVWGWSGGGGGSMSDQVGEVRVVRWGGGGGGGGVVRWGM